MPSLAFPLGGALGGDGTVVTTDLVQQLARFYGKDIWYDVTKPDPDTGLPKYIITPAGDWTLVTGIEALRQSLVRRTITNPGEWKTKPNYGVGARQYIKSKNTASARAELEARIRSQYLQDSRVESIDSVTITQPFDGGLQILVVVIPVGRLRNDQPLVVQLEVR